MGVRKIDLLKAFVHTGEPIDMSTLNSRIIFQKKVYFMQEFGYDLSYDFGWHIYGPYLWAVSADGYTVEGAQDVYEKVGIDLTVPKPLTEGLNTAKSFFEEIKRLSDANKEENYWLELASSLHFLTRINPSTNKEQTFDLLMRVKPNRFSRSDMEITWTLLHKYKLIKEQ